MNILDPQGPIAAANKTILVDSVAIMLAIVLPTIVAIFAFAYYFRASNTRAFYLPNFAHSGRLELVVWSIPALTVTLEPTPGAGAPPPIQEVAFAGSVAALNCDAGFIVVDDSMSRSRVALSGDTVITGVAGEVIDCRDLDLGEGVIGRGQITLTAPGPIDAISLQQTGSPAANTLRVFGFVSYIDCAAGLLLLSDPSTSTPVHLGGGTTIVGTDNTPLQCTDVALGDRIAGTGEVSTDAPGAIEGALLVVTRGSGLRRH